MPNRFDVIVKLRMQVRKFCEGDGESDRERERKLLTLCAPGSVRSIQLETPYIYIYEMDDSILETRKSMAEQPARPDHTAYE